jgi:hypothetical protein
MKILHYAVFLMVFMGITLYAENDISKEREYYRKEWIVFHIDENGDADTGKWIGWINVNLAPYIWSYSLTGWMYVDEYSVTDSGMWTYVFRK